MPLLYQDAVNAAGGTATNSQTGAVTTAPVSPPQPTVPGGATSTPLPDGSANISPTTSPVAGSLPNAQPTSTPGMPSFEQASQNFSNTLAGVPNTYELYQNELKSRGVNTLIGQEAGLSTNINKFQSVLDPLLPQNSQYTFPNSLKELQDVGVNQDQLNLAAAKAAAPIAQGLKDLLMSRSVIAQEIDRQTQLADHAATLQQQDYQNRLQNAQLQYNFAKDIRDTANLAAEKVKQFAIDNHVTQPFYTIGSTVFNTAGPTANTLPNGAYTSKEAAAKDGVDISGWSNVQHSLKTNADMQNDISQQQLDIQRQTLEQGKYSVVKTGSDAWGNDSMGIFNSKTGKVVPISMGADGNPDLSSAVAQNNPTGTTGGQCAVYAEKIADFGTPGNTLGQDLKAKQATVNKYGLNASDWRSQGPQVGDGIIFNYGKDGHVSVVTGVNTDGTVNVSDSNYSKDGKIQNRVVNVNNKDIYGVVRGQLKDFSGQKTSPDDTKVDPHIAPYLQSTQWGSYLRQEDFKGAKTYNAAAAAAAKAGIPFLSSTDVAAVQQMQEAYKTLGDMGTTLTNMKVSPQGWFSRLLNRPGLTLQKSLQANGQLGAFDTWKNSALTIIQAAGSIKGERFTANLITQLRSNLPDPTDTVAVAQQKIATFQKLIDTKGTTMFGQNSTPTPTQSSNSSDYQSYLNAIGGQ